VIIKEEDYLAHYGTPRHSGRYPYGSGGEPYQSSSSVSFLDEAKALKKEGLTDTQIAKGFGMSTTEYRARKTVLKDELKQEQIVRAEILKGKGWSNKAIAEDLGASGESYVRSLLAPGAKEKADALIILSNVLKDHVDEKGMIDVGSGVERYLNVSDTRLKAAVEILKQKGYSVHEVKEDQLGTVGGQKTTVKVLAPPGTTWADAQRNRGDIQQIMVYTQDNGRSFLGIAPPLALNPKRVQVNYKEGGGDKADGVLYVRPGVKDVDLGGVSYAQVRVQVGNDHYLKGMAMYKDNLPEGVDIVFNTAKKKSETATDLDAMKPLADNPHNRFGAVIRRQIGEKDENGNVVKPTSVMNLVNEEGDWNKWSKTLASQVLSKQAPSFAKQQLGKSLNARQRDFDEIKALNNPVVKRKLLEKFAEGSDAAAVQLKAAGIPRMGWHAILPIDSMPEAQIYAPNFQNGETVALIRYPHGGRFEIPVLTVNNKHPESRRLLGPNPKDAVGIHSKVAERLSGADFDGDTVLVIPNKSRKIRDEPALAELKDFDPKTLYRGYPGMKVMRNTQAEMGQISNLITDMTIRKASNSEIARAVKHSMVVIDAEKHELNHRQSAKDNNIAALKAKYQPVDASGKGGAATIISRAKGREYVDQRNLRRASEGGPIDPKTGKLVYTPTNRIDNRTGLPKRQLSTRLRETDDAFTLVSEGRTPIEVLYAEHSNALKGMANEARLELLRTPRLVQSKSAKTVYATEVSSLKAKLDLAIRNRPLERQAQLIGNANVRMLKATGQTMDTATLKKVKYQALAEARIRTGAKGPNFEITKSEWDAIQQGAISDSMLSDIIDNANMDIVRELATPRRQAIMSPTDTQRAKTMLSSGRYTRAEVASQLGVSLTTLDTYTG
jgi:hypothetical protein